MNNDKYKIYDSLFISSSLKGREMMVGFEPTCTELQSATSPLGHTIISTGYWNRTNEYTRIRRAS